MTAPGDADVEPEVPDVDDFSPSWAHLDEAAQHLERLRTCWASLWDAGGFGGAVVLEDNRGGRLEVSVEWPVAVLADANDAAMQFALHVKAAFDSALLAAAEWVSGLIESPDPEAHRLPFCRSIEELTAARSLGAFRGLRPDQVLVVGLFQPYDLTDSEPEGQRRLRILMQHLAAMVDDDRDPGLPRVSVWVHSAEPEVVVDAPGILLTCEGSGDGALDHIRTVARFSFVNANARQIKGRSNASFGLIFNDPPRPTDPGDDLPTRSAALIATARHFVEAMERSVGKRPPLHDASTSMAAKIRPTTASSWRPLDLDSSLQGSEIEVALAESDLSLAAHYDADGNMSILVRSGHTVYSRPIPSALPLDSSLARGTAAEDASLAAASMWGLPDFVMRSRVVPKSAASREVGDGTIIAGGRGLAVQVKSREAVPGDDSRETRWLIKNASAGAKQARGTVRTLKSGPLDLTNARGRSIRCTGADVDWVGVVIIDHPSPPEAIVISPEAASDLPIVTILRRDWDFLFEHLRSVSAVVDYLHRVAGLEPLALGRESVRYYELATADEAADASPPPGWAAALGDQPISHPILPKEPANSSDTTGHTVFRIVLEDIAATELDDAGDESDRLEVLAKLDLLPVTERAKIGRLLLNHLDEVLATPPPGTLWRSRTIILHGGALQLAFGTCSHMTGPHQDAFRLWAQLRHHEFTEAAPRSFDREQATVAVLLTPGRSTLRPWDTTMIAHFGGLDLEPDYVAAIQELWQSRTGGLVTH